MPRLGEALLSMRVVCVAAGATGGGSEGFTAICTDAGQLDMHTFELTFEYGGHGQLGHGEGQDEWVPRLVQALVGTKVVGVDAGDGHIVVLTEAGGVLTCGYGAFGLWCFGKARAQILEEGLWLW